MAKQVAGRSGLRRSVLFKEGRLRELVFGILLVKSCSVCGRKY